MAQRPNTELSCTILDGKEIHFAVNCRGTLNWDVYSGITKQEELQLNTRHTSLSIGLSRVIVGHNDCPLLSQTMINTPYVRRRDENIHVT